MFLVFCAIAPSSSYSSTVIRSSVSPEFIDGLQHKYLKYLALNLGMELHIEPIPFARRLRSLENGDLDIMVGLQLEARSNSNLIFLKPSYEKLGYAFFVLGQNKNSLNNYDDLKGLVIGVTINTSYFERFNHDKFLKKIQVTTIEQKIKLLRLGRIDTFIHYRDSTLRRLKEMKNDSIVVANYFPGSQQDHYFAISRKSGLFLQKAHLEQVIKDGVEKGDFQEIRSAHFKVSYELN